MIHGDHVGLVLSRAWHIEILCSCVELHSKGELSLLLAWTNVLGVARVGEVEVAWNIVLGPWHSSELLLSLLLLLHISDLLR